MSDSPLLPIATSVLKPQTSSRTRGITWTIFNYDDNLISALKDYARSETEYMIFGYEVCPTTQKKHLQGYHYYKNARAYPNDKFRKVADGVRDFISKGSPQQNTEYCSKGADIWTFGDLPSQGERTDWNEALNHLHTGRVIDVIKDQPHLIPCVRALERIKALTLQPLNRDVEVFVLIGEAGSGKSRWCYDSYPDLFTKPSGAWFDGYAGETTLLLDDFYGELDYATLLKVLDRYPLQVPVKGGFLWAQWTRVLITSNRHPEHWYHHGFTKALDRRITNLCLEYNHARTNDWTTPSQRLLLQEAASL